MRKRGADGGPRASRRGPDRCGSDSCTEPMGGGHAQAALCRALAFTWGQWHLSVSPTGSVLAGVSRFWTQEQQIGKTGFGESGQGHPWNKTRHRHSKSPLLEGPSSPPASTPCAACGVYTTHVTKASQASWLPCYLWLGSALGHQRSHATHTRLTSCLF